MPATTSSSSKADRRLRSVWRRLHLALALGLGVWFVLIGLTGSVLVFWRELDPAPAVNGDAPTLPHDELLRRALLAAGKEMDPWRYLPPTPGGTARLVVLPPEGGRLTLHLHPATGEVLASSRWGEAWVHVLYDLHASLLLGGAGSVAVGLAGLGLALQVALGVALWRRRYGLPLAENLRPVAGLRGLRCHRNRHRALGAWTALLLLVAALTGTGLAFPDTVRALARPLLPAPALLELAGKPRPLSLAAAMAEAEIAFPGFRPAWVTLPETKHDGWEIAMERADGEVLGRAIYHVRSAGAVLLVQQPEPVETLRAWIMALHNGAAGGRLHRLLVVALGAVPLAFALTGWHIWRRRRPSWTEIATGGAAGERGGSQLTAAASARVARRVPRHCSDDVVR